MTAATGHPYLFFNETELKALRERLKRSPWNTRWRLLLKNADTCVKRPRYGLRLVRQSLGLCGLTSFAYVVSGKKQYGQRALKEAWGLLSHKSWHKELGYNHGANLETSEAALGCAYVYEWCRDLLSDVQAREFRSRLLELSTRVYVRSVEEYHDWWVDNPVTNWCGVCHGGNGLAALAMYHEEPVARHAAVLARDHTLKFLRHVSGVDGDGHEGIMYWLYGAQFGNIFWSAASRFFGSDGGLYQEDVRKRTGRWLLHMLAPDKQYANFNNMEERTFSAYAGREDERAPLATLCALFESQVPGGDRALRWGADHGGAAWYYHFTDPMWFLWRSKRAVVKDPPRLADAVLFRTAGHAVLKSKDLWLAFNGGWISNASHFNRDLGTVVLVWKGRRLISDPGYGHASTAQHSTLTIAKQEQAMGARGSFPKFGSKKGFHYFVCDLSTANPNLLTSWMRHVIMVDGRYVVILDEARQSGPGRREFELRFQTTGKVSAVPSERRAVLAASRAKLHIVSAAPDDARVSTGQDKVTTYAAINPFVRRTHETLITVLYPADGGDAAPKAAFLTAGRRGTLEVLRPDGRSDELIFSNANERWALLSVNGVSARGIPTGTRQTVFRS
jgi:hypothetical protein